MALLVLVLLVVLAGLGVQALTGGADAGRAAAQQLDPNRVSPTLGAATDSPTTAPTTSPTGSATASGTATASDAGSAAAGEAFACEPAALSVVLTSDASAYGPGSTPKFTITVKNVSGTTCTVEVGRGARTFTARDSAGTRVWSSADCQSAASTQISALAPGESTAMPTTWSRQRTAAGCPTAQAVVDSGTYTVDATWDGVTAQPVSVGLTN